ASACGGLAEQTPGDQQSPSGDGTGRGTMSFLSAMRVALAALVVQKGRSLLTALGLVIGISAVIALVSAGGGARLQLDERLTTVGKNLILIRAGARNQQGIVTDFIPLTS